MKIGIDIRVLARGTRTGVEEYTINLLSALLSFESSNHYSLFYNAYQKVRLDYPWLSLENVDLKDFRIPNRLFFISARYLNYPKIDKLLNGVDLYFNPHFFVAPLSKKCKKIVTFHDLSFEYFPEFFSWRKRLWQKFLMDAQAEAKKADKIIAVSESTKQDLINLYKIDPEKIKVIYSGVGEQFKPMRVQPSRGLNPHLIREKYNLPEKFILYFGTIEPRKNLIGLIKAFEVLRMRQPIQLVIAGAKGWLFKEVFKTAKQSIYKDEIIFTGFVQEKDKPGIYNLAQVFVYPSFFEGFGFPPLEAMACGIPTIVSTSSSLPEVVSKAAIMINPNNIDELSWAMEIALTDTQLRQRMIVSGLQQAQKFSWQESARKTLEVLEK